MRSQLLWQHHTEAGDFLYWCSIEKLCSQSLVSNHSQYIIKLGIVCKKVSCLFWSNRRFICIRCIIPFKTLREMNKNCWVDNKEGFGKSGQCNNEVLTMLIELWFTCELRDFPLHLWIWCLRISLVSCLWRKIDMSSIDVSFIADVTNRVLKTNLRDNIQVERKSRACMKGKLTLPSTSYLVQSFFYWQARQYKHIHIVLVLACLSEPS